MLTHWTYLGPGLVRCRKCGADVSTERKKEHRAMHAEARMTVNYKEILRARKDAAENRSESDALRQQIAILRNTLTLILEAACTCPCHTQGGYCDQCCQPDNLIELCKSALAGSGGLP